MTRTSLSHKDKDDVVRQVIVLYWNSGALKLVLEELGHIAVGALHVSAFGAEPIHNLLR